MIKVFKSIICFIILIMVLAGIGFATNYILNNNNIKKESTKKIEKNIEKITTNTNQNTSYDIYNIYLNNERHKVKIEYQLMNNNDTYNMNLFIYFDGKNALNSEVYNIQNIEKISDILTENNKINENSFKIIKDAEVEYLVIAAGYEKRYFYIIDKNGEIKNEKGILINSNKNYIYNEELFNNYYDENKSLATIRDNKIYALEEETNKNTNLVEYIYYLENNELKKEKINIYENIKLNKDNI